MQAATSPVLSTLFTNLELILCLYVYFLLGWRGIPGSQGVTVPITKKTLTSTHSLWICPLSLMLPHILEVPGFAHDQSCPVGFQSYHFHLQT